MTAPIVADVFLELLEKSELLSPAQIAAAVERLKLSEETSSIKLAKALIGARLITRFQAERLLEGRYRGFFIDQYRLLDVLGAGSMGRLYVAEDRDTGEKVALKVLSERHKHDPGMLARFKLEARAGRRLDHPNIVKTRRIQQAGDVFDIHYIVMEFVEGISLHELIVLNGPCSELQACDLIRQAAIGLQSAHDAGLVHRDIKPANLLVDASGGVKLVDFGLALIEGEDENEFSLAMIFGHECVGTADYIAPEQSVDSSNVDARADIYSLGCTLYSALTGAFPFPVESNSAKLEAHRTQEPKSLKELVPGIDPDVCAIVARMMAKRPEDRYQTAAEVARALEPLSVRQPLSFDFPGVIVARSAQARRRAAQQPRSSRTRAASTIATSMAETQPPGKLPAVIVRRVPVDVPPPEPPPTPDESSSLVPPVHRPKIQSAAALKAPEGFEGTYSALHAGASLLPGDGGEPIRLLQDRIVIGRHDSCDIQLETSQVSGEHCELLFEGTWWRVRDLNSKNGVKINGVPVKEHVLTPGDRLTIAEQYHFRLDQSTGTPGRSTAGSAWKMVGVALGVLIPIAAAVWWFFLR